MCPTQANKTTTNPTLFPLPLHNHASSLPYRISLKGFINSAEMALRVTVQNITDILLVHIPHDSFHDRNVLRSIHEPPSLPFCSDVFHWRCVQLRQYRPLERPRRKWKNNISTYTDLKTWREVRGLDSSSSGQGQVASRVNTAMDVPVS